MSIIFLNIFTLLALIQSFGSLFHVMEKRVRREGGESEERVRREGGEREERGRRE